MSQDVGLIDPQRLAATNCDCLGCLIAARLAGDIDDEFYHEILDTIQQEKDLRRGTCPGCGYQDAYVSEWEPDVMHCPTCGLYSLRVGVDATTGRDVWQPFRQGRTIELPSPAAAAAQDEQEPSA